MWQFSGNKTTIRFCYQRSICAPKLSGGSQTLAVIHLYTVIQVHARQKLYDSFVGDECKMLDYQIKYG